MPSEQFISIQNNICFKSTDTPEQFEKNLEAIFSPNTRNRAGMPLSFWLIMHEKWELLTILVKKENFYPKLHHWKSDTGLTTLPHLLVTYQQPDLLQLLLPKIRLNLEDNGIFLIHHLIEHEHWPLLREIFDTYSERINFNALNHVGHSIPEALQSAGQESLLESISGLIEMNTEKESTTLSVRNR